MNNIFVFLAGGIPCHQWYIYIDVFRAKSQNNEKSNTELELFELSSWYEPNFCEEVLYKHSFAMTQQIIPEKNCFGGIGSFRMNGSCKTNPLIMEKQA